MVQPEMMKTEEEGRHMEGKDTSVKIRRDILIGSTVTIVIFNI